VHQAVTGVAARTPRPTRPDSVRALYVNGWAAGSRARMRSLLELAEATEINAFVIDVKESDSFLVYDSTSIALAKEIGADRRPVSRWLPELLDTLRARGIYPIARIVVFKDPLLAERRPDLAIQRSDGSVWRDAKGVAWVNPYHPTVWSYNVAIAREALAMGFAEIQWDYVRFPDVPATVRRSLVFPGARGVAREDNIVGFLRYTRQRLPGVPITADVFGMATHVPGDVGIGQRWEKIVTAVDVVLPMVYPSHYYPGMYGFAHPAAHPYAVVRMALEDAQVRARAVARQGVKVATIMPWLEAQTADWLRPRVPYGPAELRAQIQAVYDAGLKDWALWSARSDYERFRPALRPAAGGPSLLERTGWRAPRFVIPRERLSVVVRALEADSVRGAP